MQQLPPVRATWLQCLQQLAALVAEFVGNKAAAAAGHGHLVAMFAVTGSTGHRVCSKQCRSCLVMATWSQCLWRLAALVAEFVVNNAAPATGHSDLVTVFTVTSSTGCSVCGEQCSSCCQLQRPGRSVRGGCRVCSKQCSCCCWSGRPGRSVCGDQQHWS